MSTDHQILGAIGHDLEQARECIQGVLESGTPAGRLECVMEALQMIDRAEGRLREAAADNASAHRLAAWRWAVAELGPEPLDVDRLLALCRREQDRPRDRIHKQWADTLAQELAAG